MRRSLLALLFFVGLVAIWTAMVRAKMWSPVLLPSPHSVMDYLVSAARDGSLVSATVVTLRRLLIGYFIGLAIGLPLGLLTASLTFVEDTIGVLALGLQTLPSVCWVPLALLWFGQTEGAMLFVVIMGTVWSVVIATDTGVRTLPPIFARAARTMGSRPFHRWVHVILPMCIWTIALLMARPRPSPSLRLSTCSNASKILFRNLGSIPTPVSAISIETVFGEGLKLRTEIEPPSAVNLQALRKIFQKT